MSNFERVFTKGEELHPMVNKEFFTIPIAIDMEGLNKTLFGLDDYSKFLRKIKTEESFKNYIIDYMRERFNQPARKIITSKDGYTWFFIDYKKREDKPYSLKYAESLADLNRSLFFENYTDIFGNRIEFEVYD